MSAHVVAFGPPRPPTSQAKPDEFTHVVLPGHPERFPECSVHAAAPYDGAGGTVRGEAQLDPVAGVKVPDGATGKGLHDFELERFVVLDVDLEPQHGPDVNGAAELPYRDELALGWDAGGEDVRRADWRRTFRATPHGDRHDDRGEDERQHDEDQDERFGLGEPEQRSDEGNACDGREARRIRRLRGLGTPSFPRDLSFSLKG